MEMVLAARTRRVTIVLEDIYQSQNASAVIRTCECMGVQDVHVVENRSRYSLNPKVLKGSNKWINLVRHRSQDANSTGQCFAKLRNAGYRILVTDPSPDGLALDAVPVTQPIALVMGNELNGTSTYALDHADEKVRIPMFGFTESLNISVSAAICLNTLLNKIRESDLRWELTEEEKADIRLAWYRNVVRRSSLIEKEFFARLSVT